MSVVADVSQSLAEAVAPPPLAEVVALPGPKVSLWRLSVGQYHEMTRHGILGENDDVELLDGILVAKMPRSTAHSVAIMLVRNARQGPARRLVRRCAGCYNPGDQ